MKAEHLSGKNYLLHISDDEFRLIVNAMRELCFAVEDFEFQARIGCSQEEAGKVAKDLKEQLDVVGIDL